LTGFFIFGKFLFMRTSLLCLLLVTVASRILAQAPGVPHVDNAKVCMGSSAYIIAVYDGGAATTISWEESTDGQQSWHTVPNTPPYSIYPGYGYGVNGAYLQIDNATPGMDRYQYRVTLSNSSGSSGPSSPGLLLVGTAVPSKPVFDNPVTAVCEGETVLYTIRGASGDDSIYWSFAASSLADTMAAAHFNSGSGTVSLSVTVANGCGVAQSDPVAVTVNPIQNTPAGTAGGAAVCTNFYAKQGVTTTYADGSCNPTVALLPSGINPVGGNIQSCVTIDASVQSFNGIPYVPRHYSLTPSLTDPTTSTATVTLYFTQNDFDVYNAARGSNPALPINSSDAAGIANLHITQFHGTGTTPDTYVGGSGDIDPDDNNIIWNATASRWEVTFDITGFSGFFVSGSSIIPLPLTLTEFSGKTIKAGNQLHWMTTMEENTAYFEIQRKGDDPVFADLAKVPAAGNSNQPLQYDYLDARAAGAYSYRLKMVDIDGKFTYSRIVALGSAADALTIRVLPNPAHQPLSLTVGSPEVAGAVLTVTDMSGKKMLEKHVSLQKGNNSLDPGILTTLPQGMYLIGVATDKQQQTIKFVRD